MVYGILEDDPKWHRKELQDVPVLGDINHPDFLALLDEDCAYFLAYDAVVKRKQSLHSLMNYQKISSISAIHPSVLVTELPLL